MSSCGRGEYAPVGGSAHSDSPIERTGGGRSGSMLSVLCVAALLATGGPMLYIRVRRSLDGADASDLLSKAWWATQVVRANGTATTAKSRHPSVPLAPMTLAGSLIAQRRRQRRRWKASARPLPRGAIVVGSQSALGMQVCFLFARWCEREERCASSIARSHPERLKRKSSRWSQKKLTASSSVNFTLGEGLF